jgi:hypothetical protein
LKNVRDLITFFSREHKKPSSYKNIFSILLTIVIYSSPALSTETSSFDQMEGFHAGEKDIEAEGIGCSQRA